MYHYLQMTKNDAKIMILDLTVLPYNLWKKDPVSQNIFKRCAGNFVEILIYGPKRTFENFWELGGKLESHVFAVCCPFMGLIHPKNGNFIEFDHFGSMGVLRRGSYRIGAHFWVFWKMLLCAHFPQGFFESKYSDVNDVKWSTWWVSFDFFDFLKNFYVGCLTAVF